MSEDLFGNEVEDANGADESAPAKITNDMNIIVLVLGRACEKHGYLIAGKSRRVFRRTGRQEMCPVPVWETAAVHQLVEGGQLSLGGNHVMRCGAVRGPARSVLAPKSTRDQLLRWQALKPLS